MANSGNDDLDHVKGRNETTGDRSPAPINEPDGEINDNDIVFDCPHCGHGLVINYRGAGLIINCTECNEPVQVPIPDGMELADLDQEDGTFHTSSDGIHHFGFGRDAFAKQLAAAGFGNIQFTTAACTATTRSQCRARAATTRAAPRTSSTMCARSSQNDQKPTQRCMRVMASRPKPRSNSGTRASIPLSSSPSSSTGRAFSAFTRLTRSDSRSS